MIFSFFDDLVINSMCEQQMQSTRLLTLMEMSSEDWEELIAPCSFYAYGCLYTRMWICFWGHDGSPLLAQVELKYSRGNHVPKGR